MAEPIQPYHRPHEQLRTEPPRQKEHSDKYASAFVSGENMVDMSFRNPLLAKSSDHFKIGIDELTVNLSSLSMLEYGQNDVLFRIIRRGYGVAAGGVIETHDTIEGFYLPDGPAADLQKWRRAAEFRVDRTYNTMLEIMDRCNQIATNVGDFIRTEGTRNTAEGGTVGNKWTTPIAPGTTEEHFRISLNANGQLRFSGNSPFWSNFVVQVPLEKYRIILLGDRNKQFISLHHRTGAEIAVPYVWDNALHEYDSVDLGAFNPAESSVQVRAHEFAADGNLLSTLDRRVTLEIGCSLPLKNSPMIDHGVEAPDFVLGRYMFHQPYSISNNGALVGVAQPEITMQGLGARTLQGARDRVVYHHLQAQQKIQIVRLRLWARVRSYSETTKKWGMKTIICPVQDIDYWHIRMHFIEK